MECNKDEASRAKSIAERKIEQKDYVGAKKFALKAQTLYPGLEGVSQMLTTLDVYVSAESKINGEVDWYGVLSVNPLADDDTIKRQYRKLALLLHPDKNSSIGADGAFKLISEAWSMLSDKARRLAYNQRRGNKMFQQNVQRHTGGSSAPPRPSQQKVPTRMASASSGPNQQKVPTQAGGSSAQSRSYQQKVPMHTGGSSAPSMPSQYSNCASGNNSTSKPQNRSAKVPKKPFSASPHQRTDTFWTTCGHCKAQYEFLKEYRNRNLFCHNCPKSFLALETAPPVNYSKSANLWRRRSSINNLTGQSAYDPGKNVLGKRSGVGQAGPDSFRSGNDQPGTLSGNTDMGSTKTSIAAKVGDDLKRTHTESNVFAGCEGLVKKRKLGDDSRGYGMNCSNTQGNIEPEIATASGSGSCGFSVTNHHPKSTRELTPNETRKLLMVNAQKEIGEKISESRAERNKETRTAKQSEKHRASPSAGSTRKKYREVVIIDVPDSDAGKIDVPDSDFHNFDVDRSESSFADNEVWAAYDDDDGMPRVYAMIHKVVSRDPFVLYISWLTSSINTEFSNIGWISSGFSKSCGEFNMGRYLICKSINAFSQRVHWTGGQHGRIKILPQKGDSWALYRNWSSDWNEHTPDEVVHKYDMVLVLDNYSEEAGIVVAPLVKVAGFSTVFLPNLDPAQIKRIPREEMFRFSHRVLHHSLSREEAPDCPQGSIELDPAATPLELLQKTAVTGQV